MGANLSKIIHGVERSFNSEFETFIVVHLNLEWFEKCWKTNLKDLLDYFWLMSRALSQTVFRSFLISSYSIEFLNPHYSCSCHVWFFYWEY